MPLIHFHTGSGVPDCMLVLITPNWASAPEIVYSMESAVEEGITGIESREPQRDDLRLVATFHYLLEAAQADELRKALPLLEAQKVALPLWQDDGQATWLHAPQKVVSWSDAGAYAISAAGGGYAYAHAAPLLIGRLAERPRMVPINGAWEQVTLRVREDSPWDCRVEPSSAFTLLTGLDLDPNWVQAIHDLQRDQLQEELFPQARQAGVSNTDGRMRWGQEGGFTLERAQAGELLRFFADRRGRTDAFECDVWYQPGTDTLHTPDRTDFRFDSDTLTLTFLTPVLVETRLRLWQEVALVGEESQALPARTHLYEFEFEGAAPVRYTSWPAPLVHGGNTYTPARVQHSDLRLSTSAIGDECDISIWSEEPGNPLADIAAGDVERRLWVTLVECVPGSPVTSPVVLFSGRIPKARAKGRMLVGPAVVLGGLFRRKIPRFMIQKGCNYVLFDSCCGLVKASWAKTGPIGGSLPSSTVTFTPGSAPTGTYAATWFAGGWLEVTDSGGKFHRRAVHSCTEAAGVWTLVLNRPLPAACAGQTATAYPGCDGNYSTCKAKFANGLVFGGHPFTPAFISTAEGRGGAAPMK